MVQWLPQARPKPMTDPGLRQLWADRARLATLPLVGFSALAGTAAARQPGCQQPAAGGAQHR